MIAKLNIPKQPLGLAHFTSLVFHWSVAHRIAKSAGQL